MFRDVATWTATVEGGSDHAELAALAVKHARDARGVAHLVLPDEVQVAPSDAPPGRPDGRFDLRKVRADEAALATAADLVRAARRPVIVAGHGARGATAEVTALADRWSGTPSRRSARFLTSGLSAHAEDASLHASRQRSHL